MTKKPGQLIARGVCRHLRDQNFESVAEFAPRRGIRVDVMALGNSGEIWIIECKSSKADFVSDTKWHHYLEWCDRFYWAVPPDFQIDLLPLESGVILADAYGGETLRHPPDQRLSGPRRKAQTLKFARCAATRLRVLTDPNA